MSHDAQESGRTEPFVPNNEVEELLWLYHQTPTRLAEVKLFQALVDGWVAVLTENDYHEDDPTSKFLPLVLDHHHGYRVAALFTSEERIAPNVHELFPEYKYVLWTTARFALESLPEGIGVVLNPLGPLMAVWKPNDFHNKLRWHGVKPNPRPWWRKIISP